MAKRLAGKVAVITGGCSGIGRASVEVFAEEGARVIVADIQDEKGKALAARWPDAVRYVHCDVTREDDIAAAVATADREFGGLDIMFNNAGEGGTPLTVGDMTVEGWDATFALLVRGPMLGMKHALPLLRARGGGSIINTASIAGLEAGWGYAYSAAKAAVIHMTRCAAAELSPQRVRVNAICPGVIATSIFGVAMGASRADADQLVATVEEAAARMQPVPRAGLPEDVASAALYLASDDSSFVTGTYLVVDGGITVGARTSWDPAASSPLREALERAVGVAGATVE
jgi:NAD(P)-dependent dehydrogenase (short-subunit alcohol dehydrogenase family)